MCCALLCRTLMPVHGQKLSGSGYLHLHYSFKERIRKGGSGSLRTVSYWVKTPNGVELNWHKVILLETARVILFDVRLYSNCFLIMVLIWIRLLCSWSSASAVVKLLHVFVCLPNDDDVLRRIIFWVFYTYQQWSNCNFVQNSEHICNYHLCCNILKFHILLAVNSLLLCRTVAITYTLHKAVFYVWLHFLFDDIWP